MKTVLILCGGKSDEHEISLISAHHIIEALDRSLFTPVVVGISKKEGIWYLENEKTFFKGESRADRIKLNADAPETSIFPHKVGNRGVLMCEGKKIEFDVAFPILHGPFGEDGTIQGFFEIIGVPYVGSSFGSSWVCMDKVLTKIQCKYHGINIADFVILNNPSDLEKQEKAIQNLGFPLFVKPSRLGSSIGISKVMEIKQLRSAVELAFRHDKKCLIEQGIKGREIECAVLGLERSARVALPGEIVPNKKVGFYSYEAKYLLKDGAELHVPAKLDSTLQKNAMDFARHVYQTLECDGMARVDLFLDGNTYYLNEVNTIPGFTPISMFPKLWQLSGLSYSELITQLIKLAFEKKSEHKF